MKDKETPFEKEANLKKIKAKTDLINHPAHYTQGSIEPISVIEDWGLSYHLGNTVKYIARAKHKASEEQDLRKAKWYLDRYLEENFG